jgi:transposase
VLDGGMLAWEAAECPVMRGKSPTRTASIERRGDLVPGRSGKVYSDWLDEGGEEFRDGVQVATLDPFHRYRNAINDRLEDATAVLDAFHVVKLGTAAVRRRVQQEIHGHRSRKNDPLYGIRTILRCGQENLTDRQ